MGRAQLTKKLYRVVEMKDGVPHGVRTSTAATTNYTQRKEAIRAWGQAVRQHPDKEIVLLETEDIVWMNDPDPHPEHDWSEWSERTKYVRGNVPGVGHSELLHWRRCNTCLLDEWADKLPEIVESATLVLRQSITEVSGE